VFDPVGIRTFTAPCDVARVAMARSAIKYELVAAPAGAAAKVVINGKDVAIDAAIPKNMASFAGRCAGSWLPEGQRPQHREAQRLLRGRGLIFRRSS
jgi:hypothetical protein